MQSYQKMMYQYTSVDSIVLWKSRVWITQKILSTSNMKSSITLILTRQFVWVHTCSTLSLCNLLTRLIVFSGTLQDHSSRPRCTWEASTNSTTNSMFPACKPHHPHDSCSSTKTTRMKNRLNSFSMKCTNYM